MTQPYTSFDEIIVRRPAMELDRLRVLISLSEPEEFLRAVILHEDFMEALRSSSPALFNALKERKRAFGQKLTVSCYKYIARMAARPTPFGLFSAIIPGLLSNETHIPDRVRYRTVASLDASLSYGIAVMLSREDDIRPSIRFYANNSCYRVFNEIRYVECLFDEKKLRFTYKLASVKLSRPLSVLLDNCRNGMLFGDAVQCLKQLGYPERDSENFVSELIGNQLLISELVPPLTSGDCLSHILGILLPLNLNNPKVDRIAKIRDLLTALRKDPEHPGKTEAEIQAEVGKLMPSEITVSPVKHLVATGAEKATLDRKIAEDTWEGVDSLARLTGKQKTGRLENFKKGFEERYGMREVPLALALDADSGLGYGTGYSLNNCLTPLLDGLIFQVPASENEEADNTGIGLMHMQRSGNAGHAETVMLSDNDIRGFPPLPEHQWPDTFSCGINLIPSPDAEHKIHIKWAGGASASMMTGRFTPHSPAVRNLVKKIYTVERQLNDGAIVAEIVHQPEGAAGNIAQRSVTREYEILCTGTSSLPLSRQILPTDLTVSLIDDELILQSKAFGKRVIPRLSAAHNYRDDTLPVYNFLCDLQDQNKTTGGFSLGLESLLDHGGYVPRVECKNTILFPRSWAVSGKDRAEILKETSVSRLKKPLRKLQEDLKLPDEFYIRTKLYSDMELYINLHSMAGALVFQRFLRKYPIVYVREFFAYPGQRYVEEIILSYYRKNGKPAHTGFSSRQRVAVS